MTETELLRCVRTAVPSSQANRLRRLLHGPADAPAWYRPALLAGELIRVAFR
jgi:hypothetical protein